MSTSMISCESVGVGWERGTFSVSGTTLTLRPAAAKGVNGASPNELNRGCPRFAGIRSDGKDLAPRAYAWKVAGGALALTAKDATLEYRRATPQELARANTPPSLPHSRPRPGRPGPRPPRARTPPGSGRAASRRTGERPSTCG